MNPIKALINDLKGDFKCIKEITTGNYKPEYTLKEFLDIRPIFKNRMFWIGVWVVLLAFCCGYLIAAKRYEMIANNFILENCVDWSPFQGTDFNITKFNIK